MEKLHKRFESLRELADYVQGLPESYDHQNENDNRSPFFGNVTLGEAIAMAHSGWPEGMEKSAELASKLTDRTTAGLMVPTEVFDYDVVGVDYDVGEYITGVPECWLSIEHRPQPRGVRMYLDLGTHAHVSSKAIEARGQAMMALVWMLSSRGVPLQLDVGITGDSWTSGCHWSMSVQLLSGLDTIVDLDRVNYAVTHASMLRRLILVGANEEKTSYGTAGASSAVNDERIVELPAAGPKEYDLALPGISGLNGRDKVVGEAWVLEQYEKLTSKLL